jgi:hypothetical protein
MKSTKKVFLSTNAGAIDLTEGIGKADAVPKVGAPATPKDFVPSKAKKGAKVQPSATILKAVSGASKELATSTTYLKDFGENAPDPATLATTIGFAGAWSGHYTLAEKWFLYVKEQTRLAWLQANPQLDDFGDVFLPILARNDQIGTRYASTAKLFDGRREPAVKGAAVKASKKAASEKAAKKAKGTPEATATQATQNGADDPPATAPATPVVSATPVNGAAAKN